MNHSAPACNAFSSVHIILTTSLETQM